MSRNRMRNSQSLHWMGVVKWILIVGLLAGLGLCYMICKNQNLHLAQKTQEARLQLEALETRNQELSLDLESMKSMNLLRRRLLLMHSTLVDWGNPQSNWVRMDQNTRARLAKIGTMPQSSLNLGASAVTSNVVAPSVH